MAGRAEMETKAWGDLMASFSVDYPLAYHVIPLPLWRDVADAGALWCKARLETTRPTTDEVDRALGFAGYVHLYLVQGEDRIPDLPILAAQLQPARRPPFPHVALELPTTPLADAECVICNWNLAVSRPGVPGVAKGGNWTRGTRPERILEVWDALRETSPGPRKARGFFNGARVPTLEANQIREHLSLLRTAPRRMPELLLRDEVPLSRFSRVIAFSDEDRRLVNSIDGPVPIAREEFPGYDTSTVPPRLHRRIEAYLAGEPPSEPWDFDAIRPTK